MAILLLPIMHGCSACSVARTTAVTAAQMSGLMRQKTTRHTTLGGSTRSGTQILGLATGSNVCVERGPHCHAPNICIALAAILTKIVQRSGFRRRKMHAPTRCRSGTISSSRRSSAGHSLRPRATSTSAASSAAILDPNRRRFMQDCDAFGRWMDDKMAIAKDPCYQDYSDLERKSEIHEVFALRMPRCADTCPVV